MILKNMLERVINLNNKNKKITIRSSAAEYLTYVAAVGDNPESIEMRYEDENIWLTQKLLSTLYNVNLATINEHIKIFIMIMNQKKIELLGNSEQFKMKEIDKFHEMLIITIYK